MAHSRVSARELQTEEVLAKVAVTRLWARPIGAVLLFFSSRRRHTRYWRDWSSDVCSSDLRLEGLLVEQVRGGLPSDADLGYRVGHAGVEARDHVRPRRPRGPDVDPDPARKDRKSVVSGKRVDLGGRRIIKKHTHMRHWCSI